MKQGKQHWIVTLVVKCSSNSAFGKIEWFETAELHWIVTLVVKCVVATVLLEWFETGKQQNSTVATAFHYQCDDPVLFCCFPCFKPFYPTKSTVATAFHYQCDDPVLFCCFPCFKPFYPTKSTVATTHFTTSVTIQCSSAVSLFQTILKALLLLRISPPV